jgi:hypothetical protein
LQTTNWYRADININEQLDTDKLENIQDNSLIIKHSIVILLKVLSSVMHLLTESNNDIEFKLPIFIACDTVLFYLIEY